MPDERFTAISFYIVAHADDWQLFMQPNAFNDLISKSNKVVFIVTTAGDAGASDTYWAAREEGIKSSVRFGLAPLGALSESISTEKYNQHDIGCWSVNNAACYFLRLPDGGLTGNGFPLYQHQSLSGFKAGRIDTITSVDKSATYNSWSDFYMTLQKVISTESDGIPKVCINYLNPDTAANPDDHPDHIATGHAIQCMPVISDLRQTLFIGYSVGNSAENLNETDLFWKAGMFAAYEKAVFDSSGYSTLREAMHIYLRWCAGKAVFTAINP